MRTHQQIIDDAGGYQRLAEAIHQTPERVRFWAMRKSIPADAWRGIVDAGLATADELVTIAALKGQSA